MLSEGRHALGGEGYACADHMQIDDATIPSRCASPQKTGYPAAPSQIPPLVPSASLACRVLLCKSAGVSLLLVARVLLHESQLNSSGRGRRPWAASPASLASAQTLDLQL